MPQEKYLIVGGGMTADAAVQGIREVDAHGSITLIGSEPHPPYDRPPLTKGLWKGKPVESIWRKATDHGVSRQLGRRVVSLNPQARRAVDDHGAVYSYEKLLLATGGTPRTLPFGGDHILYYRTFDDYERLRAQAERGDRFVVIGGGFIGSEIAAALALNGKRVTLVCRGEGVCSRMFPADLADFVTQYYHEKNVEVLTHHSAKGLDTEGEKLALIVAEGEAGTQRKLTVDGVVAGIGIEPNVDLAQKAGLEMDDGIVVDATLRTSNPDIFAAGDVASFVNPALGKRLRVEHEDNANTMGKTAGQSMAGKKVAYDYLPYFYSDLFDLGYEAIGEVDARLETFADWKSPFREGVVYYLREGRVRGVLLWNVWEQVDNARKLIAEPGPFRPESLKGRLPA